MGSESGNYHVQIFSSSQPWKFSMSVFDMFMQGTDTPDYLQSRSVNNPPLHSLANEW